MKKGKMSFGDSWKNVLYKMKKGELLSVVDEHEEYSPDLVAIAKEVLKQKYGVTEDDLQSLSEPDHFIMSEPMTRDLFIDILTKMECRINYENDEGELMDEDDGVCAISFCYGNASFYAYVSNDNVHVSVDSYCGSCKYQDEEKVARVKEAINVVNMEKRAKLYYLKDEESGQLFVYCSFSFLLIPLIPNIELYLHYQFKSIVEAEKYYNNLLDDLKNGKKRYEKRVEDCKMRMMKERRRRYRVGMRNAVQRDKTKITGCRDLLLDTLDRMGLAYQIEKDDSIRLEYSIDTFYAEADNEHPYVTFFYYSWKSIDLESREDIGKISAISNAINNANWENRVMTVFTIDEEEKTINVHCKSEFLFIPEIPNLEGYLITELSNFFRAVTSVETGIIGR